VAGESVVGNRSKHSAFVFVRTYIYTQNSKKTAINEAVELAKIFGSESSARFVNGVLGSAMSGIESGDVASIEPAEPVPEGR
jgi:hypothetical protein